jgi:hypothetical protein
MLPASRIDPLGDERDLWVRSQRSTRYGIVRVVAGTVVSYAAVAVADRWRLHLPGRHIGSHGLTGVSCSAM